jgi:cytochrome c-type biogenesis protein CcmE
MNKKQLRLVIGISIILLTIIALSFLKLGGNIVYFYTPSEAYAEGVKIQDKVIRIGGMVQENSREWDGDNLNLSFQLTDYKGHDIMVDYIGSPPDLFKEGQGVVVEGYYQHDAKKFAAKKLMVKHSEEYQMPDAEHSIDKELLQKSIFKD